MSVLSYSLSIVWNDESLSQTRPWGHPLAGALFSTLAVAQFNGSDLEKLAIASFTPACSAS